MILSMKRMTFLAGLVNWLVACGGPPSEPDSALPQGNEPVIPVQNDEEPAPEGLTPRAPRPEGPFAAGPTRLRRLRTDQYQNAVRALVGDRGAEVALPPADVPLNGFFSVGAAELAVAANGVDAYEASAVAIAAVASVDTSSPVRAMCQESSLACFEQIARTLGRRAFRRQLRADELTRYAAIAVAAADAYRGLVPSTFDKGLEYLLVALLQSPSFLYLVEIGEPSQPESGRRLTGPELATRVSFFLTDQPPDDDLLTAAESGQLSSPSALRAVARELLTRPEARLALRNAFRERLQLTSFGALNRPDPDLTSSVRQAMVEESLRLIDDVVWDRDADLRELFSTRTTFLNDELASYYGYPLPGSGEYFARVQTPLQEGRAGLLTRGAFLVRFAHLNRSSPTLRGKFIRENLLCTAVPAPPDDVETTLPEEVGDAHLPQTTRDRMAAHMHEPRCAACHETMDPLGFAFEAYDQFGRFRTHENGLPVDSSNELDGDPAVDAPGFMERLKNRSDMVSCVVRGLYRHGTGTIEDAAQEVALYDVDTALFSSGLRLREALVELVASDAFSIVSPTARAASLDSEEN
jgi:hypothetical protein